MFAWDMTQWAVAGVLAHIWGMVELQLVLEQTDDMVQNVTMSVMDRITEYFDQEAIGENLTVEHVKAIVAGATAQQINVVVI